MERGVQELFMKTMWRTYFPGLLFGCLLALPGTGLASQYSASPLLAGPITVPDGVGIEIDLVTPVSRHYDNAELDVVFAKGTVVKYAYEKRGIRLERGVADLVITFVSESGANYGTDPKIDKFYANGVMPMFETLPPRNVRFNKFVVNGSNLPEIVQIYWVDGKKRLSDAGAGEDPAHCGQGRCHWREAVDYCNVKGGRLPTVAELKGIYKAECRGKTSDICRNWYWSSEEYELSPDNAWYVTLYYGRAVTMAKTASAYARCLADGGDAAGKAEKSWAPQSGGGSPREDKVCAKLLKEGCVEVPQPEYLWLLKTTRCSQETLRDDYDIVAVKYKKAADRYFVKPPMPGSQNVIFSYLAKYRNGDTGESGDTSTAFFGSGTVAARHLCGDDGKTWRGD
jgi:hypothetical protein